MAIKIGDRVRFLNATGGGVVSKIINKELIEVTDQDGFDIPILIRECVVIEPAEKANSSQNSKENIKVEAILPEEDDYKPEEETPEGENLNVWLACVPADIKALSITSYECYLINDSNYYLAYNYMNRDKDGWNSLSAGVIEPNTKIFLVG